MVAPVVLIALLVCNLAACAPIPKDNEVTVFAAASLTDAFEEISAAFEAAYPSVTVLLNFAGSSTLATQLLEGAPADVFASANPIQMENVVAGGLISSSPASFASNRLTIIVPAENPGGLQSATDLSQPGVVLVLAAPGVPLRDYSDQVIAALGNADWQANVYANLASEEQNARLVVAKVVLGEADAGLVYTSDITPELADQVLRLPIPDEVNALAVYPIAALDQARHPELAQAFIEFVLSSQGQAILQGWGFGAAP